MVPGESGTLIQHSDDVSDGGTMIQHATLVPDQNTGASDLSSNLGTMVINDEEDDDDDTMKRKWRIQAKSGRDYQRNLWSFSGHDTNEYRPAFMEHFEKKSSSEDSASQTNATPSKELQEQHPPASPVPQQLNGNLQRQLEQIAGQPFLSSPGMGNNHDLDNTAKYQKSLLEGDLEFVSNSCLVHGLLASFFMTLFLVKVSLI